MSRLTHTKHKTKCLVVDQVDNTAVKVCLDSPDTMFKGNTELLICGHARLDYDDAVKLANWILQKVAERKLIPKAKPCR